MDYILQDNLTYKNENNTWSLFYDVEIYVGEELRDVYSPVESYIYGYSLTIEATYDEVIGIPNQTFNGSFNLSQGEHYEITDQYVGYSLQTSTPIYFDSITQLDITIYYEEVPVWNEIYLKEDWINEITSYYSNDNVNDAVNVIGIVGLAIAGAIMFSACVKLFKRNKRT